MNTLAPNPTPRFRWNKPNSSPISFESLPERRWYWYHRVPRRHVNSSRRYRSKLLSARAPRRQSPHPLQPRRRRHAPRAFHDPMTCTDLIPQLAKM